MPSYFNRREVTFAALSSGAASPAKIRLARKGELEFVAQAETNFRSEIIGINAQIDPKIIQIGHKQP